MEPIAHRDKWLDFPEVCDSCLSTRIACVDNCVLYGRNYGKWPKIWFCRQCAAAVSCHPNSYHPMGKMANRATRKARQRAHKHFDKLFKKHNLSRTDAYSWLSGAMMLKTNDCHISQFNINQCEQVVILVKEKIKQIKSKACRVTHIKGRPVSKAGHKRKY